MSRKLIRIGRNRVEAQMPLNQQVVQWASAGELGEDFSSYAQEPVRFAIEVLGLNVVTDDQKRIFVSLVQNQETNVPSCHGSGKTMLGAIAILWWVFAVRGLGISTAPTQRQVKELLWSEIRILYDKNKERLGGSRQQLSMLLNEGARAYGFSSRDYDSNSFQGVHHSKLLVVEDEACGISPAVDDGAASCVTGGNNRLLRLGNPIAPGTPFETACKRSSIRIPAWNHPNVSWAYTQNPDGIYRLRPEVAAAILQNGYVTPQNQWPSWCQRDVIPGAISISWIEQVRERKGEGSAFWQSRVEGFFPSDNQDSIIPRSWFAAARARYDASPVHWDKLAESHQWRHGLDVGDGGDDHALASWRGPVLFSTEAIPCHGDREDVSRAASLGQKRLTEKPGILAVDRTGVGAGCLSILKTQGLNVEGYHWGSGPSREMQGQYLNLKSEQFWLLREAFRSEEVAIAPLGEDEENLMEELSSIFWDETSSGKIQIEEKSQTKKRLRSSPNRADAVVIGFNAKKHSTGLVFSTMSLSPKRRGYPPVLGGY